VITSWPSGLGSAWGVAFDGLNNTVWISSPGSGWGGTATLYEYTPAGALTGQAHPYSWGPVNGPADITFNWNTNTIWVMNTNSGVSNCLYEMDPATGFTGQTICPGGPTGWTNSQRGVAFDPTTDTFYAGGWNEGIVYHIDMAGNDVEPPVYVGLAISGLAYNPDTQHLFAMVESTTTEIFVLDASAGYTVVGQFAVSQDFGEHAGAGLEIDCAGKLWAVDQNLESVYQIESGETATLCPSIFADGFESGDTSGWSATMP
jgi:DNA-binding beta-propeller fold protein YncE